MSALKVVTSLNKEKDSPSTTIEYQVPDSLAAAEKAYGEAVVYSIFKRQLVIALQAHVRGLMKKNKRQAEIQAGIASWKPGLAVVRKDPLSAMFEKAKVLTPEQREELKKFLAATAAASGGGQQKAAAHK